MLIPIWAKLFDISTSASLYKHCHLWLFTLRTEINTKSKKELSVILKKSMINFSSLGQNSYWEEREICVTSVIQTFPHTQFHVPATALGLIRMNTVKKCLCFFSIRDSFSLFYLHNIVNLSMKCADGKFEVSIVNDSAACHIIFKHVRLYFEIVELSPFRVYVLDDDLTVPEPLQKHIISNKK